MTWLAYLVAAIIAGAIILIGALYIARPRVIAAHFGLPEPPSGAVVEGWLRLKGVRDIVSGLVLITVMIWGGPFLVGLLVLVFALIPIGDMLTILTSKGSVGRALGVHGVTAAVMLAAGAPLAMGWA